MTRLAVRRGGGLLVAEHAFCSCTLSLDSCQSFVLPVSLFEAAALPQHPSTLVWKVVNQRKLVTSLLSSQLLPTLPLSCKIVAEEKKPKPKNKYIVGIMGISDLCQHGLRSDIRLNQITSFLTTWAWSWREELYGSTAVWEQGYSRSWYWPLLG